MIPSISLQQVRIGPKDNGRIPLFQGKKQQNPLILAVRRPKATLQAIDSIGVRRKFRYVAKQRKFPPEQPNFTADQRNCSGIRLSRRISRRPRAKA